MSDLTEVNTEAESIVETLAVVNGQVVTKLPHDLYIPPDALEVFLETFEGPLDLLLYLIKKQNVDILNIPIAEITRQYMTYVELMKSVHLELAGEYLVMAAMLAEIKSRMMLPKIVTEEGEETDPRADLIRRLQEYERFKQAADDIDRLPREERDFFLTEPVHCEREVRKTHPEIDLNEVLRAMRDVLKRADLLTHHQIKREALSVRERMATILSTLSAENFTDFTQLFNPQEGRRGIVVSFLAVLELLKGSLIELVQTEAYGPIHVKAIQ